MTGSKKGPPANKKRAGQPAKNAGKPTRHTRAKQSNTQKTEGTAERPARPPGRSTGKPSTRKVLDTTARPDNRSSSRTARKPAQKPAARVEPMPSRTASTSGPKAEPIRLNRFLAQSTGLARRKADEAIEAGRVKVNGKLGQTGQVIQPGKDKVSFDGKPIEHKRRFTTIRFFKPKGVITTRTDPEGRKTIYDCLPEKYHTLDPIGRLDRDSVGLLLLTDDGDLLHQLSHPSFGHAKRYKVTLDKPLTHQAIQELEKGIPLMPEDVMAQCQVSQVETPFIVVIQLTTGYNRQIRRCFEHVGYTVTQLKRLSFGPITLDKLAMGDYKELTLTEHQRLRRLREDNASKKPVKPKLTSKSSVKDSARPADTSKRTPRSASSKSSPKRSGSSASTAPPKRKHTQQNQTRPVKPPK